MMIGNIAQIRMMPSTFHFNESATTEPPSDIATPAAVLPINPEVSAPAAAAEPNTNHRYTTQPFMTRPMIHMIHAARDPFLMSDGPALVLSWSFIFVSRLDVIYAAKPAA